MVLAIDPKALLPVGVAKAPPARVQDARASDSESVQRAATDFVGRLLPDGRERLRQTLKDEFDQNRFDELDQRAPTRKEEISRQGTERDFADRFQGRAYSAPLFTNNLVLLQSQPSVAEGALGEGFSLSARQRGKFLKSYHDAGAQPGGESAAFEAAIRRTEQEKKTLIVPPVITTVNFIA